MPDDGPDQALVLDRNAILGAADRPIEQVFVPEWNGTVLVRGMTSSDRDSFEAETMQDGGRAPTIRYKDMRAKLVVRSLVDSQGNRLFKDEDFAELAQRSAAALDRIFIVAMRLSKIGKEDVEKMMGELGAARPSASATA